MKNKKGSGGGMTGIGFGIMILTILFIIYTIMHGVATLNVHGQVEADNAAFTCYTDLLGFFKLPTTVTVSKTEVEGNQTVIINSTTSMTYQDLLIRSIAENNFESFKNKTSDTFNNIFGDKKWEFLVANSTYSQEVQIAKGTNDYSPKQVILDLGTIEDKKRIEECKSYLPLICGDRVNCLVAVRLTLVY